MLKQKQNKRTIVSIRIMQVTVVSVVLILLLRLFQLQVMEYETYGPISFANHIRQESVSPARGLIYDRSGRLLVDNQPIFTITVTPANVDPETIPLLATLLEVEPAFIEERILAARRYSWHRPSRLVTDISFKHFSEIQENIWKLPGISYHVESKRHYPSEVNASHIFGYLSEVTRQEYTSSARYQLGDKAGRSGLEFIYEEDLRGKLGARYLRVNALGQTVGLFEDEQLTMPPVKGSDIYTHIDPDLQRLAVELMEGKTGGLVVMDPNSGAVMSLVSSPTFDVSQLSGRIDMEYWLSLQADTSNPLFNRAISTMQPPGSTVKPLMGLLGLEMGIITPETEITCRGGFTLGRFYRCTREHGRQNLAEAIQNSCNTYFFSLMHQMMNRSGLNTWSTMTRSFGLGQMNEIDLPHERRGIVPDSSYYNTHFGFRQWGIGDLISVGVGQGTFSASPLQLAVMTSAIANDGYRVRPHIVDRIVTADGTTRITQPEAEYISWINPEHMEMIKEGMILAVKEGSGRFYADIPGVEVAGKTGTAQNPHGNNHGWFVAYAPAEKPEIAIAVLVENAGYGSISAAPIAGLLMEQYFHGSIQRNWVYDYVLNFEPRESRDNVDQEEAL
ncbi:penicillin-binding protein 2 [Balneolaceae bacterium ANBcel3]|nr:penicillin-binding protein 2 [Balneolaceae bacterium ANBcel3]